MIITTVYILLNVNCFSQNYFIQTNRDSVPCQQINYFDTNARGKMIKLKYVDKEGRTIELKKDEIPEIKTICQDGQVYIRMPLKIKKPDGYYRFGKRVVTGKITVDVYNDVQTEYRLKENFDGSYSRQGVMKTITTGVYIRHVRMPNATIYEVSGLKGIKAVKKN